MLYQTLLVFIGITIGAVTAVVLFWSFKYSDTRDEEGNKPGFLRRGIVGHQKHKKERNLEKLRDYINENSKVANDDVEKLLGVSHATAARYLGELEKDGVLEQVGEAGKHVYYRVK